MILGNSALLVLYVAIVALVLVALIYICLRNVRNKRRRAKEMCDASSKSLVGRGTQAIDYAPRRLTIFSTRGSNNRAPSPQQEASPTSSSFHSTPEEISSDSERSSEDSASLRVNHLSKGTLDSSFMSNTLLRGSEPTSLPTIDSKDSARFEVRTGVVRQVDPFSIAGDRNQNDLRVEQMDTVSDQNPFLDTVERGEMVQQNRRREYTESLGSWRTTSDAPPPYLP